MTKKSMSKTNVENNAVDKELEENKKNLDEKYQDLFNFSRDSYLEVDNSDSLEEESPSSFLDESSQISFEDDELSENSHANLAVFQPPAEKQNEAKQKRSFVEKHPYIATAMVIAGLAVFGGLLGFAIASGVGAIVVAPAIITAAFIASTTGLMAMITPTINVLSHMFRKIFHGQEIDEMQNEKDYQKNNQKQNKSVADIITYLDEQIDDEKLLLKVEEILELNTNDKEIFDKYKENKMVYKNKKGFERQGGDDIFRLFSNNQHKKALKEVLEDHKKEHAKKPRDTKFPG